jgi:hypothetical protein
VAGLGHRHDGRRCRLVEALGHVPGAAQLLGLRLDVAAGHVQADGVAIDQIQRLFHRDIAAALGQRHHHLDLVMVIGGSGRIGHHGVGRHDRIGRLHEEERLAVWVMAHFAGVGGIVATDAIDAADRERCTTHHGIGGLGGAGMAKLIGKTP